jgi:hypothetical protein
MITAVANIAPAMRELGNVEKQIPFALSRTINRLADLVLQHTTGELLPRKFTIRSAWWKPNMKYGFRVRRSSKSNLTASVKSAADWLPQQEIGGAKTTSGHRLAIPTAFWKPRQEIMRREKKPRAVLAKADFTRKTKGAIRSISSIKSRGFESTINAKSGIWVRTIPGPMMLFKLQPSVQIHPRLEFVATESTIVQIALQRTLEEELRAALTSAK